jgi:hypothetical protein
LDIASSDTPRLQVEVKTMKIIFLHIFWVLLWNLRVLKDFDAVLMYFLSVHISSSLFLIDFHQILLIPIDP